MIEVEFKFACSDLASIRSRLTALGATVVKTKSQSDEYLNDSLRDFAKSDKALRIRNVDGQYEMTFKGPNQDPTAKIRLEINIPLESEQAAGDLRAAFLGMDFFSVAKVVKQRETWKLDYDQHSIEICLDEVDEVGSFCEIELVVEPEQVDEAKQCLTKLAEELELTHSTRTSYLAMLLEKRSRESSGR